MGAARSDQPRRLVTRGGQTAILLCAAVAAAALGSFAAEARASTGFRIEGPFGRDANAVWVMRPSGGIRTVVVFGHGWKQYPPSWSHPYPGQFLPWLDHLASEGCAVIFPRYQRGGEITQGPAQLEAFRRGLELGFERLHHPHAPVVAVGYSYGASLAFYYAADARLWHLQAPSAVDAIFPAGLIAGPLPTLARQTRVLIQVGDRDGEAGSGGANAFWSWLKDHPRARKRYETVRSTGTFLASHAAPKETTAEARQAFWQPLDRLISQTR